MNLKKELVLFVAFGLTGSLCIYTAIKTFNYVNTQVACYETSGTTCKEDRLVKIDPSP